MVALLGVLVVGTLGLVPARAVLVSSLQSVVNEATNILGGGPSLTPTPTSTPAVTDSPGEVVGPLAPSSGETADLQGRVTHAGSGAPLSGVEVTIEPYNLQVSTDDDGRFVFENLVLPVGHCERVQVVVHKRGYELSVSELYMGPGRTVVSETRLRLYPIGEAAAAKGFERVAPPACARDRA